ncbi:hypothetical protein FJTKL_12331 [Diaporthe vaccinii]|uniref:Uncharacterized protein n=1 Tax=Diaporthe vaccinii TaxID=105482 RepID=A0ABR4EEJ3_9PEZI
MMLLSFNEQARNIPPCSLQYAVRSLQKTHKIDTNIFLANRQTFAEAKQMILRRGRLVKVISSKVDLPGLLHESQLCVIDAKYSSLSIMTHYFEHNCPGSRALPHPYKSEFVLCGRDVDTYCRAIMGDTAVILRGQLCGATRHTLAFTTNFHQKNVAPEYLTNDSVHRQVLEPFRKRLRGFPSVSLQGSCVGLSRALAATAVKEMRSPFILYPDEILSEMNNLILLSNEWLEKGSYAYTALPMYKAMDQCARILSDPDLWTRVKRKASDSKAFIKDMLSGAYQLMVMQLTTWLKFARETSPHAPYIGYVVKTYEMCLAAARSFGAPDWTPTTSMEICMHYCVARALYTHRSSGVMRLPLAIGYKAVQRALELAPATEKFKKAMAMYEDWKETAVLFGEFIEVDDDVLVENGVVWWSGSQPSWHYM